MESRLVTVVLSVLVLASVAVGDVVGGPPGDVAAGVDRGARAPVDVAGDRGADGTGDLAVDAAGDRAGGAAGDRAGGAAGDVAADASTLRFTAAGDFGATVHTDGVLAGMAAQQADLALALGDLSYGITGQEQAWCDRVTAAVGAGYPFELLAGNHESDGQNGNINDFTACLPNQLPGVVGTFGRQYYVDVPHQAPLVRFVMVSPGIRYPDSIWGYGAGTARHAWTAAAVDGARSAGIPWVVVGMHKPCLSVGDYTCESGADLLNMLIAKRVDLVLAGHEHVYGRTKQVALGAGCPGLTPGTFTAACVADADADMVRGAGTVFATVGTGGTGLRTVDTADPEAPWFASLSGSNANPTWGLLRVDVDSERLSAAFVRTSGGTHSDAFTLSPGGPPPPNQPPTAVVAAPVCDGLACSFDGSGSTDPDGTVVSWSWSFAGTVRQGASISHTFPAAGTYPVTLTVTDDRGATATTTRQVTVSGAAPPLWSETWPGTDGTAWPGGWTSSATGGSLTTQSAAGQLAVTDTSGAFARTQLTGASPVPDSELLTSFRWGQTSSSAYLNVYLRGSGGWQNAYRPRSGYGLELQNTSSTVAVKRNVDGVTTTLRTVGGAHAVTTAKQWLRLRVVGTQVQWRIWTDGTPEPTVWEGQDVDTAVTAAGQPFVSLVRSGSNVGAKTVALDDLVLRRP
ncbi:PKD domain-containing protein [Aquipuribacter hungaricus]|uniref:PKD domain-containing protein n=1 Tax=Aquipuribacter hungaricus TaxID=545624 RepID=A0ABV7WJT0_9MICO